VVLLYVFEEFYADADCKKEAFENIKKTEGMFREMGMDNWLRALKGRTFE